MSRYWYSYLGGTQTQAQLNSANYRLIPDGGKPNCTGVNNICALYAPAGAQSPQSPLSQNLQSYIIAAIADTAATFYPPVGKAFVYKKD